MKTGNLHGVPANHIADSASVLTDNGRGQTEPYVNMRYQSVSYRLANDLTAMTADSSISIYRNSPSPLHIYMQRILRVILEEANGKRLNERIQTLATLLTAGIHCT